MRTGVEPHFKEIIKLLLKTTHKFLMDSLREEMRKCFDLGIEFWKKNSLRISAPSWTQFFSLELPAMEGIY